MLKHVVVNMKALESMLFVWATLCDREKIADEFFIKLAAMPEMKVAYREDFDQNAFRRALSAICNNELLSDAGKLEKRFWNNNMWMTEDMEITNMMLEPVKVLNIDQRLNELPENIPYQEMEVIFYPGTTELATLVEDKLYINFFKIQVNIFDLEAEPTIDNQSIEDFIIAELAKAAV